MAPLDGHARTVHFEPHRDLVASVVSTWNTMEHGTGDGERETDSV